MDKKLSVIQRTTDKSGWDMSNQFNTTDINNIKTFAVKNDRSLNAIPSPLARLHLFEAAFEMLDKDELNRTDSSGDAYRKIVSDCFDVFELLYNWNNHLNEKTELTIVRWQQEAELKKLKEGSTGHQLLGDTLRIFLNEEAFKRSEDVLIIKYKNDVIAGSSPFTGFFTTPNPLHNFGLYNPINRRNYFSKIIPFKERTPKIKKYIYDFFFHGDLRYAESTRVVRDYLNKYEREIPSADLQLAPLLSTFSQVFGAQLQSTTERTDADYFEKCLVKINFQINEELFYTAKTDDGLKSGNYLLPLSSSFFEDFNVSEIPSVVTVRDYDGDTVHVTIQKNGHSYLKKYKTDPMVPEEGRIIDLNETHKIKVNLGIFPFIKVLQQQGGKTEPQPVPGYNDNYKVMLIVQDDNTKFYNRDFKLEFGINGELIGAPTDSNLLVTADERTLLDHANQLTGSVYYTIKGRNDMNVCFDYMLLTLPELGETPVRAAIVPKWRTKNLGTQQVDFAVDFGTTTTFIAYTDNSQQTAAPKALSFDIRPGDQEKDYPVAVLSKPKAKNATISWIDTFENGPATFMESFAFQNDEFIPSLLDGEKYKNPFRTVLYQKEGVPDGQKRLFGNANISFVYQQASNFATQTGQRFVTNLKWKVNTDLSYEDSIKVYIEEIFHLLKLKAVLKNGDPRLSRVSWFSPLSFSPEAQRIYERIWVEKFKEVFHGDSSHLHNITESEAPYHYYLKDGKFNDPSAVLTIDIGGGTTDMMYVRDKPLLCTSVNFGANVLWGNGFTEFVDTAKENGIYQSIKELINGRARSTILKNLNEEYNRPESSYSSDEIINFWIANNQYTAVLRELDNGSFRLTYLLHLASLIYHIAKILKANGQPAPTCIIFSGNGSKYLDLIQSEKYIGKICDYITRSVLGTDSKIPQIILPASNRKEATCYGGLYQKNYDSKREFKTVTYIGTEDDGKKYAKYGDIEADKSQVFESVNKGFGEFLDCFFRMNDEPELGFRSVFGIKTDLTAAKLFLKEKAAENLDVGYRKRVQNVGKEDTVTDSLFFNPLIGLLFRINKMSDNDLDEYAPKIRLFAGNVDDENCFLIENLTSSSNHDSKYVITIKDSDPEQAELTLVEDEKARKKIILYVDLFLRPVSEFPEVPEGRDSQIVAKKPGLLVKEGDRWVIREKMQLEFI